MSLLKQSGTVGDNDFIAIVKLLMIGQYKWYCTSTNRDLQTSAGPAQSLGGNLVLWEAQKGLELVAALTTLVLLNTYPRKFG